MTNKVISRNPEVWSLVLVSAIISGAIIANNIESYALYAALFAVGLVLAFLTYRQSCQDRFGNVWGFAYFASIWLALSAAIAMVSGFASRLATFLA